MQEYPSGTGRGQVRGGNTQRWKGFTEWTPAAFSSKTRERAEWDAQGAGPRGKRCA